MAGIKNALGMKDVDFTADSGWCLRWCLLPLAQVCTCEGVGEELIHAHHLMAPRLRHDNPVVLSLAHKLGENLTTVATG